MANWYIVLRDEQGTVKFTQGTYTSKAEAEAGIKNDPERFAVREEEECEWSATAEQGFGMRYWNDRIGKRKGK